VTIRIPSRKSSVDYGKIYFWTATINQWLYLLKDDRFKDIIVDSLKNLSDRGLVDVFAFVIMPNHIHVIWRVNRRNGKESPHGSFLKYTAHMFKSVLTEENPEALSKYRVDASNKLYEFWRRDSLAVHLFTRKVAVQKLNYIHENPVRKQWVQAASDYKYSSAGFYYHNQKEFDFLKNLFKVI
jgi:putative transposase